MAAVGAVTVAVVGAGGGRSARLVGGEGGSRSTTGGGGSGGRVRFWFWVCVWLDFWVSFGFLIAYGLIKRLWVFINAFKNAMTDPP